MEYHNFRNVAKKYVLRYINKKLEEYKCLDTRYTDIQLIYAIHIYIYDLHLTRLHLLQSISIMHFNQALMAQNYFEIATHKTLCK